MAEKIKFILKILPYSHFIPTPPSPPLPPLPSKVGGGWEGEGRGEEGGGGGGARSALAGALASIYVHVCV